MTKVYLASRYGRRAELAVVAAELREAGVGVTSRWLLGTHDGLVDATDDVETRGSWAAEDVEDIHAADCLVVFSDGPELRGRMRGGVHVEVGIALALGKRVIEIGDNYPNVFYCLPQVEHIPDWGFLLEMLT